MNWQKTNTHTQFSPQSVGIIHFVGIGGIGMSGIAEILHNLGYKVQGSDLSDNYNVKRLREKGIAVMIGHAAENLGAASVVVISSAVKKDNPEVVAARTALLPIVRRAEMLGELMRLKWSVAVGGTHGKTTTTSMVATLFDTAGLDPTVVNGGIINAYGSNARLGAGDWMVVETDESDGSFTKLPATIAIVTNIDPEHMDHYADFDAVRRAYDSFVQNIPFYGFAVLCADHPEVQAMIARINDRKIVTYGFSPQADVRALNVEAKAEGTRYDVAIREGLGARIQGLGNEDKDPSPQPLVPYTIEGFYLPVIGQHNVLNSLAVIAVGHQLGLADNILRMAMSKFEGVKRRFTRTGTINGITIVDDYGHHPVEIAATLKAGLQAKGDKGRIIAVVQPHRYTRLSSLFPDFCTCFNDADMVIVADVYPAGEQPIQGASRDTLVEGLRAHGHRGVHALPDPKNLAPMIAELAQPDDYVICLGAGSISAWAQALPGELEAILGKDAKRARG
ncbi:MAG TPA: UDP-N-acetylmuramate--L-alanine ligase [Alphaproteobacteria bacterium]|nr:UDP-N-acetylmuramate--L-alanine ligase [Alphaproteobacteria bacterium]